MTEGYKADLPAELCEKPGFGIMRLYVWLEIANLPQMRSCGN